MSYESRIIQLTEQLIAATGGTVQQPLSPSNYQARHIQLLESLLSGLANLSMSKANQIDLSAAQAELAALEAQITALQSQANSLSSSLLTLEGNSRSDINYLFQALEGEPTNLVYTTSQSTIYSDNNIYLASYAKLTDGDMNTGASPNDAPNLGAFIKFDLGQIRTLDRISMGGNQVGAFTGIGNALNLCLVQSSFDDLTWTTILVPTGIVNNVLSHFAVAARARYLRLVRNNSAPVVCEFYVQGF